MQHGQAHLHPDHAAQQIRRGDEGLVEELDVAARAREGDGQGKRGCQVSQRTGKGHGELPNALVGVLLALGIGVGVEAADGQQQHGAEAQTQPCSHHQANGFSRRYRGNHYQKQPQAAGNAIIRG